MTPRQAWRGRTVQDTLGAPEKMFYDSKMLKAAQLSFTFRATRPFTWMQCARVRGALALPTLRGYHDLGPSGRLAGCLAAGRSPSPSTALGTLSGRCTVH